MSNDIYEEESLTPEDNTEENELTEDEFELLDEKAQKTIQSLQAQKDHWRNKANKKPEAEPSQLTEEKPEQAPQGEPDVKRLLEEQDERVDLRLQGYNVDEINFASRNRVEGQSLSEAIQSNFVAAGIEATRAKAKAESGTLAPTNRPVKVNGKTFQEIVRDGTSEEKQKAFEAMQAKRRSNAE